ncbi:hypothetical protein Moror_8566 [Moniliophthora roreri MCA 2997]|uniref:DUF2415 domain-containing protein n=1 Tax=Moniliophthora roreri (strain MCA 2997) TaxID=1381753 RepID=V2XSN6_MONRO|nr:hypothetical protein Moror_8566 [Moniliophthora roreri MCA 2997]
MARGISMLSSTKPSAVVPAQTYIGHVQLRDLIICPRERGVVNYVNQHSIVEQNLNSTSSNPYTLVDLNFTPNTLSSLQIPDSQQTLLAAGGQDAEVHLSLHDHSSPRQKPVWATEERLPASINNSVLLTSMNLARSNESSVEPKVVISNNDCTVKFYDVPIRARPDIREAGSLRLSVPINHSSISPDGRTLLSVGDSSKVYLHRISGGSRLEFSHITTLQIPPPDRSPLNYTSTSLAASFSTAFSTDGTKYAVASQEGVVAVWDVRSTKPLKVFQTDKTRMPSGGGLWSGSLLSDDPYEWTRGNSKAPGWSVRNVKFGNGGSSGVGREIMTFTEHTSFLHVIDARTFETEEIVRVPSASKSSGTGRQPPSRVPSQQNLQASAQSRSRSRAFVSRPYQRPNRTNSRQHISVSATSHLGGLRRDGSTPPYVVLALEDTFRISPRGSSDITRSVWRHRRDDTVHRPTDVEDHHFEDSQITRNDDDDLVVIPPLGDREVEDNVRSLLTHHGLRSRALGGGGSFEDDDNDEQMDVDDLDILEPEWDCISYAPSRGSSPGPPANGRWRTRSRQDLELELAAAAAATDVGYRAEEYYSSAAFGDDLDIAGTCFDPSGAFIYVATPECVAEWAVRGGEKRWWSDSGTQWC